MELILKIAWRNILRHKGKSLVIGVILFLGAYLMTIGNGVITGMDQGLKSNIINGFIGHMVVVSEKQKSDNVLFAIYGKTIMPIYNYPEIKKVLAGQGYIKQFVPVGKNPALILNEESDMGRSFVLGVDFEQYQKVFPDNMLLTEGRLLKGKEHGVLVPEFARKESYEFTNIWLVPEGAKVIERNLTASARENKKDLIVKDYQVFMGMNEDNTTTDVRTPVKGIIKYRALNTFWGHFMVMDIESYRQCMGYFSASEKNMPVSKYSQALLSMDSKNLDEAFDASGVVVEDKKSTPFTKIAVSAGGQAGPDSLESGAYNLVFIKLKSADGLEKKAAVLNRLFKEKNLGVRVVTWKKASGVIGSLAVIIKGLLFGFVIFLFLVAVIIIVNTLTMAALERISEIGMMRAVGAQKSFIRNMFVAETAILSGTFGTLGIVLGIVTVLIVPYFNITTQNDMVALLYGGDALRPALDMRDIILALAQLVLVTLVSVVYPVKIAKGITPLDAVTRD